MRRKESVYAAVSAAWWVYAFQYAGMVAYMHMERGVRENEETLKVSEKQCTGFGGKIVNFTTHTTSEKNVHSGGDRIP